ncbi:MAG: UDP-glucose/GDP-mannose dehydrogenase family protein, partial [Spirochaetaceae bacterium]|nr:UDP-glucose/GDP-mannose dehydrogenase family protein [Spirochaetaceae bacterium]
CIAEHIMHYTVVVDKSTVPVGTSELVKARIQEVLDRRGAKVDFDVVSNPEFLKEGVAIEDFMRPDRVVIGADNDTSATIMKNLYAPFVGNGHPLLCMDIKSAEITKYAANAMLATRISFMNEIAQLCSIVGGDVKAVRQGIGTDARIGMSFLYAGCGYGGSCFPKDVKELIAVGRRNGLEMKVASAVNDVNERQKHVLFSLIEKHFGKEIRGKTFALWGLAFKPQTDDMREAPSLTLIRDLIKAGAKVRAYDPEAFEQTKHYLSDLPQDAIEYIPNMNDVLDNADALVLITEWKQFRAPDFSLIKSKLSSPVIFDGRNIYEPTAMKELGFAYYCIGRTVS